VVQITEDILKHDCFEMNMALKRVLILS